MPVSRLRRTAFLALFLSPMLAAAQAPELNLDGNRFEPLEWSDLDGAQRRMVANILDGPRTALGGPFNVMLRAPELGDLAQELGAYARFNSSLPDALREMAISMTAAHWQSEFEWNAHSNAARNFGLDSGIVDAIAAGRRPRSMDAEQTALYEFVDELLNEHRVSDDTFNAAVASFGERGVVDVIGTVGYYAMVSMFLNVDEYPLPDGVEPVWGQ
jgi:4-carboxymuconolactone decarboxylase